MAVLATDYGAEMAAALREIQKEHDSAELTKVRKAVEAKDGSKAVFLSLVVCVGEACMIEDVKVEPKVGSKDNYDVIRGQKPPSTIERSKNITGDREQIPLPDVSVEWMVRV